MYVSSGAAKEGDYIDAYRPISLIMLARFRSELLIAATCE